MVELTFDQLSQKEKDDVVAFYNRQGMDIGSPLTEATLPPASSPPPVTRSWRDMAVSTEVSPTRGVMTEAPDLDMVQDFQESVGLPRHGIADEATVQRMALQSLGPPPSPDEPPAAQENPPAPVVDVEIAQVEAAETTEEVIETVAEAVPTELSQNPVEYIVENNLRGLDERNPLGGQAIRGFFRTATGSSLGPEAAWCAVFVDHVLRGIDAPVMDRDQVSIFPNTRGVVGRAGPQRAREYENYGTGVELNGIKAGDLVILKGSNRASGHIGFYTGERDENGKYLVLGGNQSSGGDDRSREDLSQLVAGVVGQDSLTVRQLQQIVGADVDGAYGPATERNVRQYLRTKGIDNYAGGGSRGVSVNVSPYASSSFAAVRRIENIQDLPVDVMKEVTAEITGNAAGTR